jgi:glycosyltransferase involved in cell wall biosynthesis
MCPSGGDGTRGAQEPLSQLEELIGEAVPAARPGDGPDGDSTPVVTGLIHDYLLVMRGAERTFEQIAACYPEAPIYTLLYDAQRTHGAFDGRVARASMLQRLPMRQSAFRKLLPLFPTAIERLDLGVQDVVVSSSSAFAHGIRARFASTHICYCHSPFRYVWHERERALREVPAAARSWLSRELDRIQQWDIRAAQRVDHFIANSKLTQQRIGDAWGRDSTIVHPPVDVRRFKVGTPEDFFLIVGELVPHKCVGEALAAAEAAGRRVKVVGTGPSMPRLRARFRDTAEFLGRVQDDDLADLMSRATALVTACVEEFGIAAVESQAAGRPVIGPDIGGTSETVIDGSSGVLYPAGDFDALAEVMRYADFDRFDPATVRRSAMRFRAELFRERILYEVQRLSTSPRADPVRPRRGPRRFARKDPPVVAHAHDLAR